jgi:hypothetical protein
MEVCLATWTLRAVTRNGAFRSWGKADKISRSKNIKDLPQCASFEARPVGAKRPDRAM